MINQAFYRMPDVQKKWTGGTAKATIYDWISKGRFPEPVKLGARAVAWRAADLKEWAEDPQGWAVKQGGA